MPTLSFCVSTLLLNALVSQINRRMDIHMVKFCRSTKLVNRGRLRSQRARRQRHAADAARRSLEN